MTRETASGILEPLSSMTQEAPLFVRFAALFAALGMALPATAGGPDRTSGHFVLAQSDVEDVVFDARGRVQQRTTTHYAASGELTGRTTTDNTYSGKHQRLATSKSQRMDADDMVIWTHDRRWTYGPKGRIARMTLRYLDAQGQLTRSEVSLWDHDKGTDMVTVETTVRDGDAVLLETRYSIQTHRKRKHVSTDTSAFNPDGVQLWRHYVDWHPEKKGALIELWRFDGRDEVERHEVQHRRLTKLRQVQQVTAVVKNGRGALIETREETFDRVGSAGKLKLHTTTWFDAEDLATKRRSISHSYHSNGSLDARRIRWEHWTD